MIATNPSPAQIADIVGYKARLRHSMAEKVFFLGKVPADVTVFADFGCADGSLLREVQKERLDYPQGWQTSYIGYDHSPDMVSAAKHRRPNADFELTSSFPMFRARLERHHAMGHKVCLILSSVVHEVMSQEPGTFARFWQALLDLGCEFIAVRDMAVEDATYTIPVSTEEAEKALRCEAMGHFALYGTQTPGQFAHRAEFLEGLLKSGYRDNWENEYKERYFPLTAEQWLNYTTIGTGYALRHFDHSPLPYLQQRWWEQYGLHVPDATHVKLLLQKAPRR